jgi:hypothetical protein
MVSDKWLVRLRRKNLVQRFRSLNYGRVAEWLGRGLQNLVQRFESARDLNQLQRAKPAQTQRAGSESSLSSPALCVWVPAWNAGAVIG